MKTVDLRRTKRIGALSVAVASFAILGPGQVSAEVANANLVPADSAYIISVPDTTAAWKAWESNGLYAAFKTLLEMPDVAEKAADFKKELSIIEGSLGFKLDGATMSEVFDSADLYMDSSENSSGTVVAALKVADKDKLEKLVDLAEKAAQQAVADSSTTETAAADNATSAIVETDYNGVTIKSAQSSSDSGKVYYAQTDDYLFVSNSDSEIRKVLDRSKAESPAADTVATSEQYKKIESALAGQKGQLYVYGDNRAAGLEGDDIPGAVAGPLKQLMNNMAPISYHGTSVNFAPKEIVSYSYGILKEVTSSDSLVLQHPGDKPLQIATHIPETSLLAFASSVVDFPSIYNVADGISESSDGDLDDKLKSAEMGLGFSVKNDLIPALSNEAAFSLQNVEFSGLLPAVDATIILGVKDKAKMQKVVDGSRRMVTNAMAANASDSTTSAPEFQKEDIAGVEVETITLPNLMGVAPGFALTDDYLFIGSSKAALKNAIETAGKGDNLANGTRLSGLGHGLSGNANMIQFANVGKILNIAKQVAGIFPAAQQAVKYIDVFNVIDASAATSRVEDGALISRNVMKLK